MSDASDKVNEAVNAAKEKLGDLANNEKVNEVVEGAKEKFGELKDKLMGGGDK